jgi:hypothetical protein
MLGMSRRTLVRRWSGTWRQLSLNNPNALG